MKIYNAISCGFILMMIVAFGRMAFAEEQFDEKAYQLKYAATKYIEVHPTSPKSEKLLFLGMPENYSEQFKRLMIELLKDEINFKLLDEVVIDSMVKTYSVEEINALTKGDTSSEEYKSAESLWWAFIVYAMSPVKKEVMRAAKAVFAKEVENNPDLRKIYPVDEILK